MLRERVCLINSAASHVESDSHCERTACVTTSIFCMYAEKTLKRPEMSFHVYIAARCVIIEDWAILEKLKMLNFQSAPYIKFWVRFYC